MGEGAERVGEDWTLASFAAATHRGGVCLWAWSPTRRLARLDGLGREFWETTDTVVGLDTRFGSVCCMRPPPWRRARTGTTRAIPPLQDLAERILSPLPQRRPRAAKAGGTGFGSRLLKQTIERSLQGRLDRTIDGDGHHFEIVVPAA